jgi:predicted AAA+ superfamily ATPase
MYIQRTIEPILKKYLAGPEYIALIGVRQSGKTTLLRHIQEQIESSIFLTFEDIELRAIFDKDVKSFIRLYVEPHRVIFIDEFQYARNGGQSLKFIFDTIPGKKIIVSGSSALDLTVAAVKNLAGRVFSFTLHPLSFREFLSFKDPALFRLHEETESRSLERPMIDKFRAVLDEFVVFGGYPRVATAKDDDERRTILKNIFSIYLLRDVRDILGLIDDYHLLNLAKALALQIGNIVSFHELSTLLQQKTPPIKKFLNLFEKTFILRLVKPFFTNKRTELVKNPKVYFVDTGLRNSIIGDFRPLRERPDGGALIENHHFSEFLKADRQVKYWRTKSKAEVDFIVDDRDPVVVKSGLSRPVAGKALRSFIEKYAPGKAFVFNDDLFDTMKINRTIVRYLYHFAGLSNDRDP